MLTECKVLEQRVILEMVNLQRKQRSVIRGLLQLMVPEMFTSPMRLTTLLGKFELMGSLKLLRGRELEQQISSHLVKRNQLNSITRMILSSTKVEMSYSSTLAIMLFKKSLLTDI
jgi:hypothetical protein